jgi:hypothetical protein
VRFCEERFTESVIASQLKPLAFPDAARRAS